MTTQYHICCVCFLKLKTHLKQSLFICLYELKSNIKNYNSELTLITAAKGGIAGGGDDDGIAVHFKHVNNISLKWKLFAFIWLHV